MYTPETNWTDGETVVYGGRGGGKVGQVLDLVAYRKFTSMGIEGLDLKLLYRAYLQHMYGWIPVFDNNPLSRFKWWLLDRWFDLRCRRIGTFTDGYQVDNLMEWLEVNAGKDVKIKIAMPRAPRGDGNE